MVKLVQKKAKIWEIGSLDRFNLIMGTIVVQFSLLTRFFRITTNKSFISKCLKRKLTLIRLLTSLRCLQIKVIMKKNQTSYKPLLKHESQEILISWYNWVNWRQSWHRHAKSSYLKAIKEQTICEVCVWCWN